MNCFVGCFDDVVAFGVELTVLGAEVVVYRGSFEDALFLPVAFACFVVPYLEDDAQTFYEEDAAQYG